MVADSTEVERRKAFLDALRPLNLAFNVQFDTPMRTVYYRALEDVPLPLLAEAVTSILKQDAAFMPKPGQIRAEAERQRGRLLAAHPYEAGECCNGTGWATVLVEGVSRVTRCDCYRAYQAKLAGLGIGPALVTKQLTSGEDEAA